MFLGPRDLFSLLSHYQPRLDLLKPRGMLGPAPPTTKKINAWMPYMTTLRWCLSNEPQFLFLDHEPSGGKFCCFHLISSKMGLSGEKLLDNMVREKPPSPPKGPRSEPQMTTSPGIMVTLGVRSSLEAERYVLLLMVTHIPPEMPRLHMKRSF